MRNMDTSELCKCAWLLRNVIMHAQKAMGMYRLKQR